MAESAAAALEALRSQGASLASAESLTGGQLAAAITAVPGASEVYAGGVVSYATRLKVELLGVSEALVAEHGVVSADCALEMARGVRARLTTTYGVATTGVAGPSEQEGKGVGTVFVAVAGPGGQDQVVARQLAGSRSEIQSATVALALAAVAELLLRSSG